ncbi:MAG: phage distal tail protein [Marmoricola sp.]
MPAVVYAPVTLNPYQIYLSITGIVLGAGTDVNVQAIRGLRSLLGVRQGDQPKAQQDGTYPGFNLLGSRTVQVDWRIIRPSGTTEAALAQLSAAWQNIIDPSTVILRAGDFLRQYALGSNTPVSSMQVQLPNRAYPLLVFGRPTKMDLPIDTSFQWGDLTIPTEFTCTDGLVYDSNIVYASTGLPNPTSGLTFNATPNFVFGASSGGTLTLNNTGLYATAPFFKITGPCTNPAIVNATTGAQVKLNTTLGASDTITVDCQNGAVTLNGSANRNNIVDPASTFFTVAPGSTTIRFTSTDGTAIAGTLTGYLLPAYSTV